MTGPFSVEQLEKENMIENRDTHQTVPFGYANKEWEELKRKMKIGDQIYFLNEHEPGFHQDGHVLVHDGCIVQMLPGKIT